MGWDGRGGALSLATQIPTRLERAQFRGFNFQGQSEPGNPTPVVHTPLLPEPA